MLLLATAVLSTLPAGDATRDIARGTLDKALLKDLVAGLAKIAKDAFPHKNEIDSTGWPVACLVWSHPAPNIAAAPPARSTRIVCVIARPEQGEGCNQQDEQFCQQEELQRPAQP